MSHDIKRAVPLVGHATQLKEPTLEEMAEQYVTTLYSAPNGHGQHVHARYGRSDNMLLVMQRKFGAALANKAIDAAFAKRRSQRALSL